MSSYQTMDRWSVETHVLGTAVAFRKIREQNNFRSKRKVPQLFKIFYKKVSNTLKSMLTTSDNLLGSPGGHGREVRPERTW